MKATKKNTKKTEKTARVKSTKWHGGHWIRDAKRHAIYARDGHKCVYCGRNEEDGISLQLDHVVARARGGDNTAANIVTCCDECNTAKGDSKVEHFAATMGARVAKRIARKLVSIETAKLDTHEGAVLHLKAKAKRAAARIALANSNVPF